MGVLVWIAQAKTSTHFSMATYTPLYPAVGLAAQTAAPSSPAHYSAGVATPLGSTTSVKVSFNSELRRFPFPISSASPLDAQYEPLLRALSDSFGVNVDGIQVRYVDDEGDTITVGSDAELFEAVRCAEGAILRLSMHVDASVRPRPPHPVPRGGMPRGGRRGRTRELLRKKVACVQRGVWGSGCNSGASSRTRTSPSAAPNMSSNMLSTSAVSRMRGCQQALGWSLLWS